MGAEPVKALPPTASADAILELAEKLTTKNASKICKELLALAKAQESNTTNTTPAA